MVVTTDAAVPDEVGAQEIVASERFVDGWSVQPRLTGPLAHSRRGRAPRRRPIIGPV